MSVFRVILVLALILLQEGLSGAVWKNDYSILSQARVIDNGDSILNQITKSDGVYEFQQDINLEGKVLHIPAGSVLVFSGGVISNGEIDCGGGMVKNEKGTAIFDSTCVVSNIGNEEVSLNWFQLRENADITDLLQRLVSCKSVKTINLAGKELRIANVELDHSLSIIGEGAVFYPEKKSNSSYRGLFICEDGDGEDEYSFSDFSVVGDPDMPLMVKEVGDKMFDFRNCGSVVFTNVTIGNITGGYGSSSYGYEFNAALIACYDVRYLAVCRCEFYNNQCFEWICDMPVSLHREDINVCFEDNYIHDAIHGASIVYFICNDLSISNNIVRNCQYTGSLFNAHGYVSSFTKNTIDRSVYSSVFDTCEYGRPEKTNRGEVCFYSKRVVCKDNFCSCANATFLVTWAEEVLVESNLFFGMCLCDARGVDNLGSKPDDSFFLPTNKDVRIVNNCFVGDYINRDYQRSYCPNYIRVWSVYSVGQRLVIDGNYLLKGKDREDFPIAVQNMHEIVFSNNRLNGCFQYEQDKWGVLSLGASYSVYAPLTNVDMDYVELSGNRFMDYQGGGSSLYKTMEDSKPFMISRSQIINNKF